MKTTFFTFTVSVNSSVKVVRRQANEVAHSLAKVAHLKLVSIVWLIYLIVLNIL
jgi:beta-lactamase regulating signal transducer with metallopeptidase domain